MVRLEKIRKSAKSAFCDVYIENTKQPFPVQYDFSEDSFSSNCPIPAKYQEHIMYLRMIKAFLSKLKDAEKIPESKTILWY